MYLYLNCSKTELRKHTFAIMASLNVVAKILSEFVRIY